MQRNTEAKFSSDSPPSPASPNTPYELARPTPGHIVVDFAGALDSRNAPAILRRLQNDIGTRPFERLTARLDRVDSFDDHGAMVLVMLRQRAESAHARFDRVDPRQHCQAVLSAIGFDEPAAPGAARRRLPAGPVTRLGAAFLSQLDQLRFMIAFIGSVFLAAVGVVRQPRALRLGDVLTGMEKTGVNALPIVGLISFLLGLVMAFMSSLQLQQFGANIYVASLVAIAMVSELGPIMTAIVVAGRSGSAYAAEIGTMKISEEIDALTTMGFDPIQFLALPRIVAAVLVVPLLTLFANIFAIAGGLFVGVGLLNLTAASYLSRTLEALSLFEVVWGLGKSVVFAVTIAMVGCLRGVQTRGGADAVGNAATSAVVTSIFLIILLDSIFAVVRSYWR